MTSAALDSDVLKPSDLDSSSTEGHTDPGEPQPNASQGALTGNAQRSPTATYRTDAVNNAVMDAVAVQDCRKVSSSPSSEKSTSVVIGEASTFR